MGYRFYTGTGTDASTWIRNYVYYHIDDKYKTRKEKILKIKKLMNELAM